LLDKKGYLYGLSFFLDHFGSQKEIEPDSKRREHRKAGIAFKTGGLTEYESRGILSMNISLKNTFTNSYGRFSHDSDRED